MLTFAYEYPNYYEVIVTDGTDENSFSYQYTKMQDIEVSINEAKLLAEHEMSLRNPVPTPV